MVDYFLVFLGIVFFNAFFFFLEFRSQIEAKITAVLIKNYSEVFNDLAEVNYSVNLVYNDVGKLITKIHLYKDSQPL